MASRSGFEPLLPP